MWYEAMPPLLIIGTLMFSYQIGSIYITKAFWGKVRNDTLRNILRLSLLSRKDKVLSYYLSTNFETIYLFLTQEVTLWKGK